MTLQSHDRDHEVVSVTTARLSHSADIDLRERRYILTQLVRVVCVVLAVALPVPTSAKLLLGLGAVCLPWFGVVAANAGPTVSRKRPTAIATDLRETLPEPVQRIAIEPGRVVDAER